MYRRNRWQESAEREGSGLDSSLADYGLGPEEYEMYRYNIPPRYDGSRFRRTSGQGYKSESKRDSQASSEKQCATEPSCRGESECSEDTQSINEQRSPCESEHSVSLRDEAKREGILQRMREGIGGEELLIISLILIIAGCEDGGEVLLFLLLLLLNG